MMLRCPRSRCAAEIASVLLHAPAILREPSKHIGVAGLCQPSFPPAEAAPKPGLGSKTGLGARVGGILPAGKSAAERAPETPVIRRRARKISKSGQHCLPEPIRLAGVFTPGRNGSFNSRVLQWLVLCGIPNRGSGVRSDRLTTGSCRPHLTQRTSSITLLPTSLNGQATRPLGGSTAHLQPFNSSIGYPAMQVSALRSARTANASTATC